MGQGGGEEGVEVFYCYRLTSKTKDPPYGNSQFLKTGFCPPFCRELAGSIAPLLEWAPGSEAFGFPTTPGLLWMLESPAVIERRRIICNLIAQGWGDAVKFVAAVSNICC